MLAAARMVKDIVAEARLKQRPTHFLSIPIKSDFMKKNFNQFKVMLEHPLGIKINYWTIIISRGNFLNLIIFKGGSLQSGS